MATILLLEDDLKMATETQLFLNTQGYHCDIVNDGGDFFKQVSQDNYQLYILDINVPTLNGMEVCKQVRETDSTIPILMLTAYGGVDDKVQALSYGADDYLVKPYHLNELLARVKALLRRASNPQQGKDNMYMVGDLEIDATAMQVKRGGKTIQLTPKEYKLLRVLALARGKPVSKQTIAEEVWDLNFETGTNTIEVYISFLRNKIDKGFENALIHTRAGYGYYLKETK